MGSTLRLYNEDLMQLELDQLKIGMICFAKPALTKDMCIVQKEEFSLTCYMCDPYGWQKAKYI
jgi:hypothetical protein